MVLPVAFGISALEAEDKERWGLELELELEPVLALVLVSASEWHLHRRHKVDSVLDSSNLPYLSWYPTLSYTEQDEPLCVRVSTTTVRINTPRVHTHLTRQNKIHHHHYSTQRPCTSLNQFNSPHVVPTDAENHVYSSAPTKHLSV